MTRRELLASSAAALLAGSMSPAQGQHVHQTAAEEKKATGAYKPKLFNDHEFATIRRLSELIVPADQVSLGAVEGGAPEFIDLLAGNNVELGAIYTGGLGWLDHAMRERYSASFIEAKPSEQTAMLDLIAYRRNDSPELGPGIRFFDWVRKMVVDAFYTSPIGVKDIGYMGNKGMTTFQVPAEAIAYAVKRSGL